MKKSMRKLKRRKTNKKRKTYKGGSSAAQHDVNLLISEKIFKKLKIRATPSSIREYSTHLGTLPAELVDSIMHALTNPNPEELKELLIHHKLGYELEGAFIITAPPVEQ
jgi:hypothetical protein